MRRYTGLRSRGVTVCAWRPDMAARRSRFGWLLLGMMWCWAHVQAADVLDGKPNINAEPLVPLPLQLNANEQLRELGRKLFFDVRLSGNEDTHCGSCHQLPPISEAQIVSGVSTVMGRHKRSVPLLYNVSEYYWFNWDGRFSELEQLVDAAISDPDKMNANWDSVLARLGPVYTSKFNALDKQSSRTTLAQAQVVEALVAFLRSLNTPNARLDRFLRGDQEALSPREQAGYRLFKEVGCATCHNGRSIGANFFEQFYVYRHQGGEEGEPRLKDQGRYYVTGESDDANVFRVPSLRNVVHSAPYFHDGSTDTLEHAIEEMAEHQLGVELSEEDVALLVSFLNTLTGSHPGVTP